MFRFCCTIILVFGFFHAFSQAMEGMILDKETQSGVAGVNILNKRSGETVYSDKEGNYSIPASAGDTLLFRHTAYLQVSETMPYTLGNKFKTITMAPRVYKLKETTITAKTKFQQDSIAMHEVYGHELAKPPVPKPKFTGLGCAGCFGWLADKITGNSKKPKRFKKQFADDDQAKFIDSRYTPELVAALTQMKDADSIAVFMQAYPMAYDFARATSDLEMKGWIRSNYKDYLKHNFTVGMETKQR